jgi:hypothetical protein
MEFVCLFVGDSTLYFHLQLRAHYVGIRYVTWSPDDGGVSESSDSDSVLIRLISQEDFALLLRFLSWRFPIHTEGAVERADTCNLSQPPRVLACRNTLTTTACPPAYLFSHTAGETAGQPLVVPLPGPQSWPLRGREILVTRDAHTTLSFSPPLSLSSLAYWFGLDFSPLYANWLVAPGQLGKHQPRLVPQPQESTSFSGSCLLSLSLKLINRVLKLSEWKLLV